MFTFILIAAGLAAAAEPAPMFQRAANLLEDRYLWLDNLDVRQASVAAAEEAESAIPWLIVTPSEDTVTIEDARSQQGVTIAFQDDDSAGGLGALVDALGLLERTIKDVASPLPEDVDLRVELTQGVMRTLDRHTVVMAKNRLA